MPARSRRPLLLAAGLLVLAPACGSTVEGATTLAAEPGLSAAGVPAAPADLPAADAGVPTAGVAVQATDGTGGSTGARPAAGRPDAVGGTGAPPPGDLAGLSGVTDTTITIGVIAADPSTDQTMEDAGLGAASLGNEPANWKAVADEVNANGGIAGRQLEIVFHLVNLTDSPQAQGQAACARFTEDNSVAAVLSGYYYAPAHVCLSQEGVPALLGTNYGVDRALAAQSSTVVAWATPLLDRLAAVLPDAFRAMGTLEPGTTAGIFVTDAPAFMRSASQLGDELERRGLTVVIQTVRDSDTGDYSGASADASAAVLRFRSAGVTEVMFLTHNAFEPTLLMQSASSQGYRPTYLLSTQQYPASLVGLVPAEQLAGAVAVGWAPVIDLSAGFDESEPVQRCLRTLEERGRTFSGGTQTLAGLLACDGMDLLDRAAERPGALADRDALLRAALAPDTGFASAVTFQTSFPDGRRDGVAAYRPMTYGDDCGCFTYTGPTASM